MNTQYIKALIDDTEFQELAGDLFFRWKDESGYEDVNDYAAPLQNVVFVNGLSILKMTKSPFGLHVKDLTGQVFHVTVNSRSINAKLLVAA